MNRTVLLLTLASGFLLGACGDGSKLPTATGKGSIAAINAISGSPSINFLIEERGLGAVAFQSTSSAESYDDLNYTFNFDVFFAGDDALTRIASQNVDVAADQIYTLVASGTLAAPTVTVWEAPKREFADSDTVFRARFAHTSNSLGAATIDVYFALEGVAPVAGQEVATLNFGEISDTMDFEADAYVVTITTSGNPGDVLFTSQAETILARADMIITPFDGDANNTAPLVVRGLGALGGEIRFHDPLYPSTIQFLHAALEMGNSDVFDDAALTSQILADHGFQDLTTSTPIVAGNYEFFYTPAGDTSMVSLQTSIGIVTGSHFRVHAVGAGGVYSTATTFLDRRSIDTAAKLLFFQSSNNFQFTDLYLVDVGATIDGEAPFRSRILSQALNTPFELTPGSYDMYLTEFGATEILAGPFSLDVAFGDVVDMLVYDNAADPAILDIETVASP